MTVLRRLLAKMDQSYRIHARMRVDIARRVEGLLKTRGWKQVELAKTAGVDEAVVSRLLRGESAITTQTIAKLESALERQIIRVLDPGEDERPQTVGSIPKVRIVIEDQLPATRVYWSKAHGKESTRSETWILADNIAEYTVSE